MTTTAVEFPVTWQQPGDEALTWIRDPIHFPAPVTPMTGAYLREILEPGIEHACEAMVFPLRTLRHTPINGWVYQSPVPAAPPEGMGARIEAHTPVMGDHMDNLRRRWDEEYLPEVRRLTAEIDALDLGGTGEAAAAAFERLVAIGR